MSEAGAAARGEEWLDAKVTDQAPDAAGGVALDVVAANQLGAVTAGGRAVVALPRWS